MPWDDFTRSDCVSRFVLCELRSLLTLESITLLSVISVKALVFFSQVCAESVREKTSGWVAAESSLTLGARVFIAALTRCIKPQWVKHDTRKMKMNHINILTHTELWDSECHKILALTVIQFFSQTGYVSAGTHLHSFTNICKSIRLTCLNVCVWRKSSNSKQ